MAIEPIKTLQERLEEKLETEHERESKLKEAFDFLIKNLSTLVGYRSVTECLRNKTLYSLIIEKKGNISVALKKDRIIGYIGGGNDDNELYFYAGRDNVDAFLVGMIDKLAIIMTKDT